MHNPGRIANLLGATALTVTEMGLAGATASGVSASGAAALVTLANARAAGLGISELGRRVGLSQSAAARMVDSLEANELVSRVRLTPRLVLVRPTRAGTRVTHEILGIRGAALAKAIATLDKTEQEQLDSILGKVLTQLYSEIGEAELMCRLCDRKACVSGAPCPVGKAARKAGA